MERFFRDLTKDVIREGSFGSVPDLAQRINQYLAERNLNPKRYDPAAIESYNSLASLTGLPYMPGKVPT